MLVRDWIQSELVTALSSLTVNSIDINIVANTGARKNNCLLVYIGDETNVMAINDAKTEAGSSVAFELILEMNAKGDYISIQNEALEKIKKKLLTYRSTLSKRMTNDDFQVDIIDIAYNNIYAPEDMNDRVVLAMIQGEIIINQIYIEV